MPTWKDEARKIAEFCHACVHGLDGPFGECASYPCDLVNYPMVNGRRDVERGVTGP